MGGPWDETPTPEKIKKLCGWIDSIRAGSQDTSRTERWRDNERRIARELEAELHRVEREAKP